MGDKREDAAAAPAACRYKLPTPAWTVRGSILAQFYWYLIIVTFIVFACYTPLIIICKGPPERFMTWFYDIMKVFFTSESYNRWSECQSENWWTPGALGNNYEMLRRFYSLQRRLTYCFIIYSPFEHRLPCCVCLVVLLCRRRLFTRLLAFLTVLVFPRRVLRPYRENRNFFICLSIPRIRNR